MTDPQFDSTGEPANDAARLQVEAAQRESAQRHAQEHEPPPGSWRAKIRNYEPEFITLHWDGADWEIPAKVPLAFVEARNSGDARVLMESIIGVDGMRRLRIPTDIDFELLGDMALDLAEHADEVWDVPNRNRSARRSRGTTRR